MKISRWWLATLVLGLAAMQGCRGDDSEPDLRIVMPDSLMRICPKTWDWPAYWATDQPIALADYGDLRGLRRPEGEERTPAEQARVESMFLSGPGETQNTAEFHDCQAFINDLDYASPNSFTDGILAIFAVRKGAAAVSAEPLFQAAAVNGNALPAAQIFALSAYGRLGIQPGFSCLYLYKEGNGWAARLRSDGWTAQECRGEIPRSVFNTLSGEGLTVTYTGPQTPDPVPMVARWHWFFDPSGGTSQEYKMGVWCDGGWCEVGRGHQGIASRSFAQAALEDPAAVFETTGDNIMASSQGQIPGWYDEQIVSVHDPAVDSLEVSDVVGTILPEPALGRYTDPDFSRPTWLPAAKVALTPLGQSRGFPENPFAEKFSFAFTPEGTPLNSVYLCRGGWEEGCQEGNVPEPAACDERMVHRDGQPWWAKVVPGGEEADTVSYHCVARCPYSFQVAGTTRWRWLPDDPVMWIRCIDGCCEVNGKR